MSWVSSTHHIFSIKTLLSQLWHGESSVLLGASGCERGETSHEKVESGEGNEVSVELPKIRIKLPWEPEASGDSTHAD